MSRRLLDTTRFADRVMAEITGQPTPTPARTLGSAVRTRDPGKGLGAMWSAWHLATVRSGVRFGVRARSAALVAAVALLMAIGASITAAGAGTVVRLATDGRFEPTWFLPGDSDESTPAVTPRVTPSAEPSGDTYELRDAEHGADGDPADNRLAPTPTADEQGQDDGQDQDEQQPDESAEPDPSQPNDGTDGGGSHGRDEDGQGGQGGQGGGGDGQ